MYIEKTFRYDDSRGQHTRRARFLCLLQLNKATIAETCCAANTYAVVRKVALHQLGHWMMGRVRLGAEWATVSGAYGDDGMPMNVDVLPKDAKPLPLDLYNAWCKGEGWNSAGSEVRVMVEWAKREFKGSAGTF